MKKWLICGGRDAPASLKNYVADVLDRMIILQGRPEAICEGESPRKGNEYGFDHLAKDWANDRRIKCIPFPADWKKYGKAAGPIRNKRMLEEFKPDIVLAFPGKNGTENMIAQAKKAGVKVIMIPSPADLGYVNIPDNRNGNVG